MPEYFELDILTNEIERLRELVKEAYHEGFHKGNIQWTGCELTPDDHWHDSDAKRELAGAISSRSEELDKCS